MLALTQVYFIQERKHGNTKSDEKYIIVNMNVANVTSE